MRDYLGRNLCRPCWNGNHYLTKHTVDGRRTSIKLSNCETVDEAGAPCDCQCRALLEETQAKRRKWMEESQAVLELEKAKVNKVATELKRREARK